MPKMSSKMIQTSLQTLAIDDKTTIFILTKPYRGLSQYEQVKILYQFMRNDTKILENCIDTYLRQVLSKYGIIPQSTDESALNRAFDTLKSKRVQIAIVDRYKNVKTERILGISPNKMTVILDDDKELSCAIEVREESI